MAKSPVSVDMTSVGGHDKYSHTAFSLGRKPTRSLLQKS
jgi:hypothetical protein